MSNISDSFKSLSHPIRVQILLLLAEQLNNGYQFTELSRELQIESSSKLSFHMDKLHEFISQDHEGRYYLNTNGQKAVDAIRLLGIEGRDSEQIAQMLATPVRVESQSDETTITSSKDYSYGLVFLGSLAYYLFIVVGIPLISLIMLSSNSSSASGTLVIIVPAILLSILSISLGMIIYALINRQHSIHAWQDLSFFILVISFFLPANLGVIFLGSGILLFMAIPEYMLISLGTYLVAQVNKSKIWSTTYLKPHGITNNRVVLSGLLLSLFLSLPFYNSEVIINTQSTEARGVSSSFIGSRVFTGFSLTLMLLAFIVLFQGRNPIKRRYQGIYLLVVAIFQVMILAGNSQIYASAIDIDRNAGWILVAINILSGIASVFGAGLALKFYHTHIDGNIPLVEY